MKKPEVFNLSMRRNAALLVLLLLVATSAFRFFHTHQGPHAVNTQSASYFAAEVCPVCDYLAQQHFTAAVLPQTLQPLIPFWQSWLLLSPDAGLVPTVPCAAVGNKGPPTV